MAIQLSVKVAPSTQTCSYRPGTPIRDKKLASLNISLTIHTLARLSVFPEMVVSDLYQHFGESSIPISSFSSSFGFSLLSLNRLLQYV